MYCESRIKAGMFFLKPLLTFLPSFQPSFYEQSSSHLLLLLPFFPFFPLPFLSRTASNMVQMKLSSATLLFALSAFVCNVQAAPMRLEKRIAQVIADSTAQWEKACVRIRFCWSAHAEMLKDFASQIAAGGGQQCNPISVTAFTTLLAAAGPCEQQDAADSMIDLAKQLNNDADMIKFTQIFAQQPRNTVSQNNLHCC